MPTNTYTNRQIEAANILSSSAKDGVSQEAIDEIVTMIGEAEQKSTDPSQQKEETELSIKFKLLHETDWRKRAALSAMLISKSLE